MAELRRCSGSAKFGIAAHDAPVDDFPLQSSQRDGLGRMCRPHWNEYTSALRKAALARKSTTDGAVTDVTAPEAAPSTATAKGKRAPGRRRRGEGVGKVAQEPSIE